MSHDDALGQLQTLLQSASAADFERLVAGLFGTLLDCNVFVSKSGFQFGADAGTATPSGVNIRFECKRYSEGTSLDERELLGEIDQALQRDKSLEAWVLAATRDVNEQLAGSLQTKGEGLGLPVVIVDWQKTHEFPRLAALCTADPTLVGRVISPNAERLTNGIRDDAKRFLERLRQEVQSWCLGYLSLKRSSHDYLQRLWTNADFSHAVTGQNMAAGHADQVLLRREAPYAALEKWWTPDDRDTPLAVVGREGVGKTWVCIDWLIGNLHDLPITLLVNASFAAGISDVIDPDVCQMLAHQLHRQNQLRDVHYWTERVKRTLQRPTSEGPAFLLFLDGLNERRNVRWSKCIQMLQCPEQKGRICLVVSTRPDYFRNDLKDGRVYFPRMASVEVNPFDITEGGELDQLLAMHSLSRAEFGVGLLEICSNPRMLSLALSLRSSLRNAPEITTQRILWEYGRDQLSNRATRAFSEDEWREWLTNIAKQFHSGMPVRSLASLEESVSRPALEPYEVYRRLSEIIDGQFAKRDAFGKISFSHDLVEHALGLQLVAHLSGFADEDPRHLSELAHQYLEPLSGLGEIAAILRAATNIATCSAFVSINVQATVVGAWLQCQNLPESHENEVLALARPLTRPMLLLISNGLLRSHERGLSLSIAAIRDAMELDAEIQSEAIESIACWFERIPLDLDALGRMNEEHRARQRNEIEQRIGTCAPGRRSICGIDFVLSNDGDERELHIGIQLMRGTSLAVWRPIFERFAIMHAISPKPSLFQRLDWVCLLNEKDGEETNQMLRELSQDLAKRVPGEGIHDQLTAVCAETLLLFSTNEEDAILASEVRPHLGERWDYETDYLSDPLRSFFALERRHVQQVLADDSVPIIGRLRRAKEFFVDPTLEYPESFEAQLAAASKELDTTQVDSGIGQTDADFVFDMCLPAIAASTPESLMLLVTKRLADINAAADKALYWRVMRTEQCFVAIDDSSMEYEKLYAISSSFEDQEKWLTDSHLLFHEIFALSAIQQCTWILRSDLDGILNDFQHVLRPLSEEDSDELIRQFGGGQLKQRLHLLVLLSFSAFGLSEQAIDWVLAEAFGGDEQNQNLAFLVLARLAAEDLGHRLLDIGWKWQRALPIHQANCGSFALIRVGDSVPFDQLAIRIAPGLLLHAVRIRGNAPVESELAFQILRTILDSSPTLTDFELQFDVMLPQALDEEVRLSLDYGNEFSNFSGVLNDGALDEINARRREANAKFREYVNETQQNGSDLLLSAIDWEDVEACLATNAELVGPLLEGLEERSVQFCSRVRRAELLYFAICESLLRRQEASGYSLWRALNEIVLTRYVGAAQVHELLHILYRAPDCPEVNTLRAELLELESCNTDKQLFEIALAAQYNGASDWLQAQIEADRSSGVAWKLRRSFVLEAFTVNNSVTLEDAWPSGQVQSEIAGLRHWSSRRRVQEAFSRHWWCEFITSTNPIAAYRAWILFLESSDRRAYLLVRDAYESLAEDTELNRRKRTHLVLNKDYMKRAFEEKEKKLDERFLNRDIAKEIYPWRRVGRDEVNDLLHHL